MAESGKSGVAGREYVTVFEIGLDDTGEFPHFYARPSDFASTAEMEASIRRARDILDGRMVRYLARTARTIEESTTERCIPLRDFLATYG